MRRVLMVEDNEADALLIKHLFRRERIRNPLVAVTTVAAALEVLFDPTQEPPMLALLDLNLGSADIWEGLQVLRAMRREERTRAIPAIILTVMEEQAAQIEAQHLSPSAYQRKPLDMAQLLAAVKALNLQWELLPGEEKES